MAATVEDVLRRARGELGYDGGGTCDNPISKYGQWFGIQTQWCAEFCSWCLHGEGVDPLGRWEKGEIYCPAWVDAYRDADRWTDGDAEPGDLVFYDWEGDGVADHVGLVAAVAADGSLTTIEGNTDDPQKDGYQNGNCVRMKQRSREYVLGFGRPQYLGTSTLTAEGLGVRAMEAFMAQLSDEQQNELYLWVKDLHDNGVGNGQQTTGGTIKATLRVSEVALNLLNKISQDVSAIRHKLSA